MKESNLPILRGENVQMIAQSAPQTYETNQLSCTKCTQFGQNLLQAIQREGMSDDLDKACAEYLEKARRTVKAMNERRSPITKLFDQIRTEFTGMENAIDASKKDSVPYQIQQYRNQYADFKRKEAERIRQEELRRQQREQSLNRYKQDVEDDCRRQFDQKITNDINALTSLNQSLTVANFDEVSNTLQSFEIKLGNEWFQSFVSYAHKPYEVTDAEAEGIKRETLNRLSKNFKEQYVAELGEYRDTITDALPAKLKELQRMAQASAEEAARLKAELEAREAAETRRLDEERKRKEEEERAAAAVKAQAAEMDGLFNQAAVATPLGYQPKTAVKQLVKPHNADGILAIVSMWWSKEGQFMPLDELEKIFKKQITYVNKLANDKDSAEFIQSPHLHYEEEVKAK